MADLVLPNYPIDQNECIGDSLDKINDWFESLKDFVNKPLLQDAIWIYESTVATEEWHGRIIMAVNSTANTTLNVILPPGLPAGYDVTVIRIDTTNVNSGKVAFRNDPGNTTLLSTPTNDFRFLAFNYSIGGAYHPGNTLLNNFILFGDLLPS